jgi:hypothetical protein
MSPGFRKTLRFAGVPVDSSEPVRRQYGSRMIGIVTVCLLPLLVFDVPLWVLSGARACISASPWPEINPGTADALSLIV